MLSLYERTADGSFQPAHELKPNTEFMILSQSFSKEDARTLVDTYDLADHIIRDAFDNNELPRVETENDIKYIFLRNSEPTDIKSNSHPVLFIVGKNILACLSTNKHPTEDLMALPEEGPSPSIQRLLNSAISRIAKNYESIIDSIGDKIESIERRMKSHEASNDDFYSFVTIESRLNRSKMSLTGLSAVADKLSPDARLKADRDSLGDTVLFAKQLLVEIESHLQTIKSIREAYSTVANNTLNQRMKLLTALTLLLALPNVFYGMYGMNIKLPFMNEPWAYPAIVGFTVFLIITVYLVARKKKIF